jgi:hypothetical protein
MNTYMLNSEAAEILSVILSPNSCTVTKRYIDISRYNISNSALEQKKSKEVAWMQNIKQENKMPDNATLSIVCFCLFAGGIMAQKDLTDDQKSFQDSIFSFLQEEGYVPHIDIDGWIQFKREGDTHWIRIYEGSPFFVVLQRSGYKIDSEGGLNRSASQKACNEVNAALNAVKLYCTDKSVVFVVEQYVRSAEDFKMEQDGR